VEPRFAGRSLKRRSFSFSFSIPSVHERIPAFGLRENCNRETIHLDIESLPVDHRSVAHREIVLPTLPSFPAIAGGSERATLLAGLTFIEGATSGWMARELLLWFGANAELLGWPGPPATISDVSVGTLALQRGVRVTAERVAHPQDLSKLLAMARWQVVVTLRGLLSGDDRFLKGAIFAGRVRRDAKASAWLARPREAEPLSDIVISLFAADILAYREFHDQALCVCDVCGRVSYNPKATSRAGCCDHVPGTATSSGVRDRREADTLPPPPTPRLGPPGRR
jgi:hypothetical protein